MPGWRNEHLKYHLKRDGSGTKCWFNPDDDEMPRLASTKPAKVVQVAAAAATPILVIANRSDPVPPPPAQSFDERWDPGVQDFDEFFTFLCGGPCPQIVSAGYETFQDEWGRLRYRRADYTWNGEAKKVKPVRYVR